MRVELIRFEATGETDPKFKEALNKAVNNPPKGYFYADMKFAMATIASTMWQEVIIIYMEIPSS